MAKSTLTEGSIPKHLIRMATPMMIGITANMSFNLVDTFFVGTLGVDQLTAIGFSFPVMFIFLNLAIGFSIGVSSVLARALGEEHTDMAKDCASLSTIIAAAAGLVIAVVGIQTIEPLFTALGARPSQLPYIKDYMMFTYPALGLRMVTMTASGVFRANGNTMVPSSAMLATSTLNFILDPIFIFGYFGVPALGIQGAGIATMISNFFAMSLVLHFAVFKYKFIAIPKTFDPIFSGDFKEILYVSAPAAVANALNPLSQTLGNWFLAKGATEYVAGMDVSSKLQFFGIIPVLALSAAMGPVVGQNFGKKQFDRVRETIRIGFLWTLIYCSGLAVVLLLGAGFFSSLFTSDIKVIGFAKDFLNLVSFSLFGYGFVMLISSAHNAVGKPYRSFAIIGLRTFGLFGLMVIMTYPYYAEKSVIYSMFMANFVAGVIAYLSYRKHFAGSCH